MQIVMVLLENFQMPAALQPPTAPDNSYQSPGFDRKQALTGFTPVVEKSASSASSSSSSSILRNVNSSPSIDALSVELAREGYDESVVHAIQAMHIACKAMLILVRNTGQHVKVEFMSYFMQLCFEFSHFHFLITCYFLVVFRT